MTTGACTPKKPQSTHSDSRAGRAKVRLARGVTPQSPRQEPPSPAPAPGVPPPFPFLPRPSPLPFPSSPPLAIYRLNSSLLPQSEPTSNPLNCFLFPSLKRRLPGPRRTSRKCVMIRRRGFRLARASQGAVLKSLGFFLGSPRVCSLFVTWCPRWSTCRRLCWAR